MFPIKHRFEMILFVIYSMPQVFGAHGCNNIFIVKCSVLVLDDVLVDVQLHLLIVPYEHLMFKMLFYADDVLRLVVGDKT